MCQDAVVPKHSSSLAARAANTRCLGIVLHQMCLGSYHQHHGTYASILSPGSRSSHSICLEMTLQLPSPTLRLCGPECWLTSIQMTFACDPAFDPCHVYWSLFTSFIWLWNAVNVSAPSLPGRRSMEIEFLTAVLVSGVRDCGNHSISCRSVVRVAVLLSVSVILTEVSFSTWVLLIKYSLHDRMLTSM